VGVVQLIRQLQEGDTHQRVEAVHGLCARGGADAVAALERALGDPDPIVRAAALAGLAECGAPGSSADAIATAAGGLSPDLRLEAARVLLGLGDRRGAGQLLTILGSEAPPFVRMEAQAALRELARQSFGYDAGFAPDSEPNRNAIEAWEHWLEDHADELDARLRERVDLP
jgi:HEAT repeat protein